ncbi:MAG: aerobic-type carbon monoxide dehydrogenase small subunit (CoxS/CutS family), partial [Planctomycetota bacterium]
ADGLNLTPIQEAMVKFGGLQCGFCTSGMVLTLSAFLAENRSPTREEVRHALSGNLCRCTGYTKIVDAAMSVAEEHVT